MKKCLLIALLTTTTLFTSCSDDIEDINYLDPSYRRVPIEEAVVPNALVRGKKTELTISYFRPSDCHSYSGIDDNLVSNELTISILNVIVANPDCEDLEETELIRKDFTFFVGLENSYVFRFWQGEDDQGNSQFLTIEVPVIE